MNPALINHPSLLIIEMPYFHPCKEWVIKSSSNQRRVTNCNLGSDWHGSMLVDDHM
jgi:hypothetical protein